MRMEPFAALLVLMPVACGGENTPSNVDTPGAEKDAKTKTLGAGAALLQGQAPLGKLNNAHLDDFHSYSGNM